MKTFNKICFGVLAIIAIPLLGGYAFMKLWQWFIVYAFDVQPINLIQSIGIVVFLSFFKPKNKYEEELTWEKFTKKIYYYMLWFVNILVLGYLITLFQ